MTALQLVRQSTGGIVTSPRKNGAHQGSWRYLATAPRGIHRPIPGKAMSNDKAPQQIHTSAPSLSWTAPHVERLQQNLWRDIGLSWTASLILVLVLPLLGARAVEQPFYSLGHFEGSWEPGIGIAAMGSVLVAFILWQLWLAMLWRPGQLCFPDRVTPVVRGTMNNRAWRATCVVLVSILSACGTDAAPETADVEFVPPRDTDILLADIEWSTEGPQIGTPTNLTQRADYDNQPHFVPDGSGLWYTANDPQNGQSDIWRYDFASGMVARVTASAPESEYSATPLPDGSGISTIRVEADSMQRLWRFDGDGSNAKVLMPALAPVGYHTWADENTLVMFVLGRPATLQRGDVRTGQAEVVAENIGRSIWTIPGTHDVSFMQQDEAGEFAIMRLPFGGGAPELIIQGVPGAQYHAWAPDGTLFTANEHLVYARSPEIGSVWQTVGDFMDLHLTFSRLAVSPDGSQIALVAELAALENFPGN